MTVRRPKRSSRSRARSSTSSPTAAAKRAEEHARRVDNRAAWEIAGDAWEAAGNMKRARAARLGDLRGKTHKFSTDDFGEYQRQMKAADGGSLRERQTARGEFAEALRERPQIVAERVGWLLDGNYGRGTYEQAQRILDYPRMNRTAWLVQHVAALEWSTPPRFAVQAWKKLDGDQKAKLAALVDRQIASALHDRSRERRKGVRRSPAGRSVSRARPAARKRRSTRRRTR